MVLKVLLPKQAFFAGEHLPGTIEVNLDKDRKKAKIVLDMIAVEKFSVYRNSTNMENGAITSEKKLFSHSIVVCSDLEIKAGPKPIQFNLNIPKEAIPTFNLQENQHKYARVEYWLQAKLTYKKGLLSSGEDTASQYFVVLGAPMLQERNLQIEYHTQTLKKKMLFNAGKANFEVTLDKTAYSYSDVLNANLLVREIDCKGILTSIYARTVFRLKFTGSGYRGEEMTVIDQRELPIKPEMYQNLDMGQTFPLTLNLWNDTLTKTFRKVQNTKSKNFEGNYFLELWAHHSQSKSNKSAESNRMSLLLNVGEIRYQGNPAFGPQSNPVIPYGNFAPPPVPFQNFASPGVNNFSPHQNFGAPITPGGNNFSPHQNFGTPLSQPVDFGSNYPEYNEQNQGGNNFSNQAQGPVPTQKQGAFQIPIPNPNDFQLNNPGAGNMGNFNPNNN